MIHQMYYDEDIDGQVDVIITSKYFYPINERLMCNACGTVSNHHKVDKPMWWKHKSWPEDWNPHFVCNHTCCRCGNDDWNGVGFLDSGNYECNETRDINKWERELDELKSDVEDLEYKIKRGKARWAELWESDKDVT